MTRFRILIVDDVPHYCEGIKIALGERNYDITLAGSMPEAMQMFTRIHHDIVISDIRMPKESEGLDLLKQIKQIAPETAVIMITAFGDIETAVQAMQLGAVDFVTKPFTAAQIEIKVQKAVEKLSLQRDNELLRKQLSSDYELIGDSPAMRELKETILHIANTESWVLITGENGTGKELVARAIVKNSPRANKPFVKVNCAALPDTLIESELFGSEKGSFTGSTASRQGKFVQADGGTIFLDEIADMPLAAQAKVLRVLESKEISPLGSGKTIQVDFRVICATNKDLPALINTGAFREDLFYRINKIPVRTLPLRVMKQDIMLLVQYMLVKMGKSSDISGTFTDDAIAQLQAYDWPGNVRELNNIIERAIIFSKSKRVSAGQIQQYCGLKPAKPAQDIPHTGTMKDARNDFERSYIIQTLDDCKGNVSDAAKRLDLQRSYLHQKINELGITQYK
jgi:two-component system nitrogen regulation response regulator NtrX